MSSVDITHALEVCRQAAVVLAEKEKLQSEAATDVCTALTHFVDAHVSLARAYVGQLTIGKELGKEGTRGQPSLPRESLIPRARWLAPLRPFLCAPLRPISPRIGDSAFFPCLARVNRS